jgi:hypothetical protein
MMAFNPIRFDSESHFSAICLCSTRGEFYSTGYAFSVPALIYSQPLSSIQNLIKGGLNVRKGMDKTSFPQDPGHDLLTVEQQLRAVSQHCSDQAGWHRRQEGRPVDGSGQGPGHFSVGDRVGRSAVHRPAYFIVAEEKGKNGGQIMDMDPGKPLITGTERAAKSQFEHRNHFCKRTAVRTEHDPESAADHPGTGGGTFFRLLFPFSGKSGKEINAGRRMLIKLFIPPVSVIPYRRSAYQDGSRGFPPGKGFGNICGGADAALSEPTPVFFRPGTEQGGAGQIDYRIMSGSDDLPFSGLYRISLKIRKSGQGGFPGGSGKDGQAMAGIQQAFHKVRADEPCPAGDKNLHGVSPLSMNDEYDSGL